MIGACLSRVVEGGDLGFEEAREIMGVLMRGEASEAQVAALLVGLKMKGERPEEIAGFAATQDREMVSALGVNQAWLFTAVFALGMRDAALPVSIDGGPVGDTCGTGGDRKGSFNISTTAACIAAGAGLRIAKHGNRAISSACGSADVLEALGVKIEIPPERVRECVEKVGLGFIYAPLFHPAMRHVMKTRKELGFPTVFNLLGPLTNPARVSFQVLGVHSPGKGPLMAQALARMPLKKALVVHGADGMDELTITGSNLVWEIKEGEVKRYELDPGELGIPRADQAAFKGGNALENARILREVLQGKEGPCLRVSLLNAAAALVAGEEAEDFREGLLLAERAVREGAALSKLEELIGFTRAVEERA